MVAMSRDGREREFAMAGRKNCKLVMRGYTLGQICECLEETEIERRKKNKKNKRDKKKSYPAARNPS